jgi:integrase
MSKEPTVKSCRDLAVYYIMFECAMKRSELRDLQFSSISKNGDSVTISIKDTHYQLSSQATLAVDKWLAYLPERLGFVFRRIDRHSNIGSEPLNDSSIYRISRQASDLLGLSQNLRFTGQSARVGAAKELEKQGYDLRSIQEFGRWLSPAMPAQYLGKESTAELEKAKFKIIKPWE